MKKGDILSLKIEKFALGGQGLGFVDINENGRGDSRSAPLRRLSLFVDNVCVGDETEIRLVKKKSSFGEGKLMKITKPSNERIAPRCKHFERCGGCSWQFLAYEKQLAWKEQLVRETMQHIGGFSPEDLEKVFGGIVGCDEPPRDAPKGVPWFYRNKMEWSFSIDQRNKFSGGFHVKKMHYDTVNVEECFLQSEKSVAMFKAIRAFFAAMHERGEEVLYDMRRHSGFLRSVFVREGKRTGEYMVILQSSDAKFDVDGFLAVLEPFSEIVSVVQLVVHHAKGSPTRLEERILRGRDYYREEMRIGENTDGGTAVRLQFHVKPLAFFQPNTMMAEKIYGKVVSLLREQFTDESLRTMRVYDLYCGTGTIGIVLSRYVESVIGIELNANAVASAKENAELNGVKNITFHEGDVKEILGEMRPAECITIDPPRSGMELKVLEQVMSVGPKAIVYISCNPATFARDARLLLGAYKLAHMLAMDQFPQTAHIETVALFLKA